MNKLLLLLSIVFGLSACASEEIKDENALPPGIMQAVDGTGAVEGGSWLPEIEQSSMPANMN
ncbi:hypothetical protein ACLSYX_06735 [[Pasteurella] aerogenes]|nr:hypothetical protein [[Pasteurella] aerogenes]MCI7717592.1 hypothetical protein [[Pasteurella] aerogenes]MCU9998313.1 hypothetical protein [[Pasteurella] aerogenes]MDY2796979.1 hypothetical protein [[Pasteurella] aerogenes]MDY4479034.1 hypothetical protein [[Pasteurella] aerogenes]